MELQHIMQVVVEVDLGVMAIEVVVEVLVD